MLSRNSIRLQALDRLILIIGGAKADPCTDSGDIGPECFWITATDGTRYICYRGEWFTPVTIGPRIRLHNWLVSIYNRKVEQ